MQRIAPIDRDNPSAGLAPVLEKIKAKFGKVPNIMATAARSPATLNALMGVMGSMGEASLDIKTQEAIALYVGQVHGCQYCTAAHTAKAKMLAGASEEETLQWRKGKADDKKIQGALDLARTLYENRGQVDDAAFQAARDAGLDEAEMLEVVGCVVQNTFTNYINALVKTEIDFPAPPEMK